MDRKMRRYRQELPADEVSRILRDGKVGVLAVEGDDGYPYAVPLNYVADRQCIYFHCAARGHKIDALRRNPKCSMCIIEKDDVVPEKFTSYFRSVIAFGHAEIIDDIKEKRAALMLLCDKYSLGIDAATEISKFLKPVCIVRIKIDSITGKEAIELTGERK